jgi:Flp pilus assembly protein TadG
VLLNRRHRPDEGASAVEFALVSLILVTVLFGIIQFGYLFWQWLEMTHAAREGARWAALRNDTGSVDTVNSVKYKVKEAAPGLSPRLSDGDISVTIPGTTDVDTDGHTGKPVTVTVSYGIQLFVPLSLFDLDDERAGTLMLESSATQRIE